MSMELADPEMYLYKHDEDVPAEEWRIQRRAAEWVALEVRLQHQMVEKLTASEESKLNDPTWA